MLPATGFASPWWHSSHQSARCVFVFQQSKENHQDVWKRMPLLTEWGFAPNAENTHVFVCGNPEMIESMVELLMAQGFHEHTKKSPGQIHVEHYW
jgi:NAD(P)H-flavin reductase